MQATYQATIATIHATNKIIVCNNVDCRHIQTFRESKYRNIQAVCASCATLAWSCGLFFSRETRWIPDLPKDDCRNLGDVRIPPEQVVHANTHALESGQILVSTTVIKKTTTKLSVKILPYDYDIVISKRKVPLKRLGEKKKNVSNDKFQRHL